MYFLILGVGGILHGGICLGVKVFGSLDGPTQGGAWSERGGDEAPEGRAAERAEAGGVNMA